MVAVLRAAAQAPPPSVSKPVTLALPVPPKLSEVFPDPTHLYTLPELIDFAESHNPGTRIAWEIAKQRASQAGVARSALYPTLAVAAVAQQTRVRVLFGNAFFQQDVTSVEPAISVVYTILDFGRRANLQAAETAVLAADFAFNDTHRRIVYAVTASFYRLNSAVAQTTAAEATLTNAQTIQTAAETRLTSGLATLPDVLQARAANSEASYQLETVRGLVRLAHGDLAEALGVSPTAVLNVRNLDGVQTPELSGSATAFIERALQQRPDLLSQVAQIRADEADVRSAKSRYSPTLAFRARLGEQYQRGLQPPNSALSSTAPAWQAQLNASWTVFDGRARFYELDRARSALRQAEAEYAERRDRIEDEVWSAYSNVQTSLRREDAARDLLQASEQSYNAALEAYRYGVRNFLDVVSAQRTLAQARTAQIQSQAEVLTNFATLAFASGEVPTAHTASGGKP